MNTIDRQHNDKALLVASMARSSLSGTDEPQSKYRYQQMCDSLAKADPGILSISIYEVDGNGGATIIASSDPALLGGVGGALHADAIKEGRLIWGNETRTARAHTIEVIAPISVSGRQAITFSAKLDLGAEDAIMRDYKIRVALYSLIGILTIAFLLYLVIRVEVFKPLWQLAADAQEIAGGNFNRRILISRNDEMGVLSRELDIMILFLRQREEENKQLLKNVREKWVKAETKSNTDFLTNLDNHSSFQNKLETELVRAAKQNTPVSLLFCDLDSFKAFNDANGHPLGDKALFDTAKLIKRALRENDVSARYGGEEFAIILPGTEPGEAIAIAERLRHSIDSHGFTTKSGMGKMTISIGVATYPDDTSEKELLIAAADYAMYESKKSGGNTITVFTSFGHSNPSKAS